MTYITLAIPTFYLNYIVNKDSSNLSSNELKKLHEATHNLDFIGISSGESYFSWNNDIIDKGCDCVDCIYSMKKKNNGIQS